MEDLGGASSTLIYNLGSLTYGPTYGDFYNNVKNYINSSPEEKGYADGAALSSIVEGGATYAPLGVYGRIATGSATNFLSFKANEAMAIN